MEMRRNQKERGRKKNSDFDLVKDLITMGIMHYIPESTQHSHPSGNQGMQHSWHGGLDSMRSMHFIHNSCVGDGLSH